MRERARKWCGKYAAHVGHDWTLSWQPYRCGGVDTVGLDDGPVITIEARRQLAQWEAEGDIGLGHTSPVSNTENMTSEPGAEERPVAVCAYGCRPPGRTSAVCPQHGKEPKPTAEVDDLMALSAAISTLRDRGWTVTPPPGTYPPEPVPTGPGTIYTPEQALAVALFNAGLRSTLWRPGDEGAAGFGMPFTEAREALRLLRGMSWELVDRG